MTTTPPLMKTLLISGGASGIGLATVKQFLENGYQVTVLDRQDMPFSHPALDVIQCDLVDIPKLMGAIDQASKKILTLDALVCSAGIHFSATIENSSEDDYERIFSINFKSAFLLTKHLLPLMKHKGGSIVYVGSDQNFIGKPNSMLYGASKAALGSLAKTTALDYASYNIRANLVAAGTIETPLYHHAVERYCARSGARLADVHKAEALEQPLGRLGQPEEVASLIYYLCTPLAAFITGAMIPIDGGYTAQ